MTKRDNLLLNRFKNQIDLLIEQKKIFKNQHNIIAVKHIIEDIEYLNGRYNSCLIRMRQKKFKKILG